VRQLGRIVIEAGLALLATAAALLVRDNFEIVPGRWEAVFPFLVATAVLSLCLFPVFGLHRSIWRFNSSAELPRLAAAAAGVTLATLLAMFLYDRLTSIPRALPVSQFVFILASVCGVRVLARYHHISRRARGTMTKPLQLASRATAHNVLVVGRDRLAEAYLQAVSDLAPTRVKIVGLLGRTDQHVGRQIGAYPVIGLPQDIDVILRNLDVHGVRVDKIIVTMDRDDLSPEADAALRRLQVSSDIAVQYLADLLDLSWPKSVTQATDAQSPPPVSFQFSADELAVIARRPYWRIKRAMDIVVALVVLIVTSPVLLLLALGVALSIGRPVLFWQQRPGLGGVSFRLHKFRTMKAAFDAAGRPLDDAARTPWFGDLLRRTRLDELPQLFSVLTGAMSLVGPRPLLPRDQADEFRARLIVRPGLTGWAQVVGGRALSAEDKAALDVWYVHNASLRLDLEILARTVPILVFGERFHDDLVSRAWSDLMQAGIVVGDLADGARPGAAN
jgi:lipopolysaccharide/colanic/teichoic acid biosynthesis glycosyltransferase